MTKAESNLRRRADELQLSYEELLEAAKDYLEFDKILCDGGKFEGMRISDAFWNDYEIVMGRRVSDDDRGSFFSCSC